MIQAGVLLGPAGSGKSTALKALLEQNPKFLLTATTGVAALNLEDATTINSLLGYFDEASLRENMTKSYWSSYKYEQLKEAEGIVIEEISMMKGAVLDLVTSVLLQISAWRQAEDLKPLKVLLVGDFLQLPPVAKEGLPDYAFNARWWPEHYQPNVKALTQIYRQLDPQFQHVLNLARRGAGMDCYLSLKSLGATFRSMPWYGFPGFSLYPTNASVEVHNRTRLGEINEPGYSLVTERWGQSDDVLREIPDVTALKKTCRVRLTANSQPNGSFANGQLANLLDYGPLGPRLLMDGSGCEPYEITLPKIVRFALRPPVASDDNHLIERSGHMKSREFADYLQDYLIPQRVLPFYDPRKERIAYGAAMYYPLTLGYASTIHKAQGLTFDQVQVDFRNRFAGNPQSMYVALSRVRTLQGLTLVGEPSKLATRINTASAVMRYV